MGQSVTNWTLLKLKSLKIFPHMQIRYRGVRDVFLNSAGTTLTKDIIFRGLRMQDGKASFAEASEQPYDWTLRTCRLVEKYCAALTMDISQGHLVVFCTAQIWPWHASYNCGCNADGSRMSPRFWMLLVVTCFGGDLDARLC